MNRLPAAAQVARVLEMKYGPADRLGWGPKLRAQFNYQTPDDLYEAYLDDIVTEQTTWLDVGCGRKLFPRNVPLSQLLSKRCRLLVGVDPSDNVQDNPFVHERAQCEIQDYKTDHKFDLITLRMVAEHVSDPKSALEVLARLVRPGGLVVIYTVWKWAPVSIVAALTPMRVHHMVKHVIWRAEERDTFPVEYQMNTRKTLKRLFEAAGFSEQSFFYLDDCRASARSKFLNTVELSTWRALQAVRMHYPERCILGTYRRSSR